MLSIDHIGSVEKSIDEEINLLNRARVLDSFQMTKIKRTDINCVNAVKYFRDQISFLYKKLCSKKLQVCPRVKTPQFMSKTLP